MGRKQPADKNKLEKGIPEVEQKKKKIKSERAEKPFNPGD